MRILGLMSGTSLDGIDLILCDFESEKGQFTYQILKSETIPYPKHISFALSNVFEWSAVELAQWNSKLSYFFAESILDFLKGETKPDYIASHGHTLFHMPEEKYTFQLGSGAVLAQLTGIPVVCDFRSGDLALGGQGAPLVPAGDAYLFPNYAATINLGGIANISFEDKNGNRRGVDVCPCNMVLNKLAGNFGESYDFDGAIARKGNLNEDLLIWLNNLPFYKEKGAKSLGAEWVNKNIFMYLKDYDAETFMRSFVEHIAIRISNAINAIEGTDVLFTGGGVHNTFLMERIKELSVKNIVVPDRETVDFKEALIFAFLGFLYVNDMENIYESVTGASRNSIGGALYKV